MPPPTTLKGAALKKKLIEIASTTRPDRRTDVYVSSATGHQIREDGGGGASGWRDDRNRKLKAQFASMGSVIGTKRKLGEITTNQTHHAVSRAATASSSSSFGISSSAGTSTTQPPALSFAGITSSSSSPPKQIFTHCTIYINGNTALSGISDIELKRLLTAHGAKVSYHLARRQVTHVILTDPSAPSLLVPSQSHLHPQPPSPSSVGTCTGTSTAAATSTSTSQTQTSVSKTTTSSGPAILSSRKVELEMKGRVRSKIHYVSVDWALASMKDGRRLAETKFPVAPLREARQGTLAGCKKVKTSTQRSLADMLKKQ